MTELKVVLEGSVPAWQPGWCALNSAHTYERGQQVGFARHGSASGPALGWLCPDCTQRYSR